MGLTILRMHVIERERQTVSFVIWMSRSGTAVEHDADEMFMHTGTRCPYQ